VAKSLARCVVEVRYAACVNIIPSVTSVYWWQGKVEEDSEVLLMMKTLMSNVPKLSEFIKKHHPYDVPEVLSIKVEDGNMDYLKWVQQSVKPFE